MKEGIAREKKVHISAINYGTSIDHIIPGKALKLLEVLGTEGSFVVTIALNVESKKIGKKDLIFFENRRFTEKEINKIKLIARNSTLNTIKDYEVEKKERLGLPERVEGVIECINPNCITNVEGITTKFSLTSKQPLKAKCFYCETTMEEEEIEKGIK